MLNRVLLLVIFWGAPAGAWAGYPDPLPNAIQYARAGKQVWAMRTIGDNNTTTLTVNQTAFSAGAAGACFGFGTPIVVTANAETTCCLTLTATVTIGSQTTALATQVTDANGPDGPGACVTLQANERYTLIPDFLALSMAPGARSRLCSGSQASLNDIAAFRPLCRVDGDCTDAGVSGGTCLAAGAVDRFLIQSSGCAFLVCKSNAASTDITTSVER